MAQKPELIKLQVWQWLIKHDPEQYAYDNYGKAVDYLSSGAPFQNTNIPPGLVYQPWSIDQFLGPESEKERVGNEGGKHL